MVRVWQDGTFVPMGVILPLLLVASLWTSAAREASHKEDILTVRINLEEDSSSPSFQRVLETPESVASITICLHIRILFLRTNPSIVFYLQDAPYFLSVRDGRLEARVGSLVLTHRHPLTTHSWQHVCLVMGERPALALHGKYTEEVDVRSTADAGRLLQRNASLWLGRRRDGAEGLWNSVGGFATLPQVFLSCLEEDKVGELARCGEGPADDLGNVAWQVAGRDGEVLGQVNLKELQRVADLSNLSVRLESADGVCPPHVLDQLLLLPGHYAPRQAARRCRALGGQLPCPEDARMTSLANMVAREWPGGAATCWATPADKHLLIMAGGKVQHQVLKDALHPNASTGLCCQIPLGPIAEMRIQKLNYDLGRFAIVPWATQLRFVSTDGDMIYIQEEQLQAQISGSWAWSTAFSGHWTGRHEVISSFGQRRGLGRQVVVSVCGEDEFTCSDGYCVPLNVRCDGHDDCGDEADEERCDIIPANLKEHRLSYASHSSAPVNLTFTLVMIKEVNEVDPSLKVWLQLQSTWQDDSLTLWHLSHHPEDNIIPEDRVPWIPSYRLDNVFFDDFLQRHSPEHKVVTVRAKRLSDGVPSVDELREGYKFNAGNEAALTVTEDLQASFTCSLDYELYPFDIQVCEFNLSLITRGRWKPYFNKEAMKTISKVMHLNLFTVMSVHQQCPHSLPERPSFISYRVLMKRRFFTFIWNTFLPSSLISCIGNMTIFFDQDNFSDRIMVTLSCLIVLTSMFSQTLTNGLLHAQLRLIDVFFFFIILRLVFVFMVHMAQWGMLRWLRVVGSDLEAVVLLGGNKNADKDSTKATAMKENVKTHLEGESHKRKKGRHKELMASRDGWVNEVAGATLKTNSLSMEIKNNTAPSSSCRSSFKIIIYKILKKYGGKVGIVVFFATFIIDLTVLIIFMKALYRSRATARAKIDEYCDTNLE